MRTLADIAVTFEDVPLGLASKINDTIPVFDDEVVSSLALVHLEP